MGLFDIVQTEGIHCVINEIKGLRVALFSFVYPFQDYNASLECRF